MDTLSSKGWAVDVADDGPEALEVQVEWAGELWKVFHLSPPRALVLADGCDGDMRIDRELLGGVRLEVPANVGVYDAAGLTFRVVGTGALPAPAPRLDKRGWRGQSWLLGSALLHGLFLLLFALMPPASSALSLQDMGVEHRYAKFLQQPVTVPLPELPPETGDASGGSGDPVKSTKKTVGKAKGRPGATAGVANRRGPAQVESKSAGEGIASILRQANSLAARVSTFTASVAEDSGALDAMAEQIRAGVGGSTTIAGVGIIGTGRGPGTGVGDTIDVGTVTTRGRCRGPLCTGGAGNGRDYGDGIGLLGRKGRVPARIRAAKVSVKGSLSKETIRRVIGRQLSQIRHCYEQGLVRRPSLQGRVAMKFLIQANGVVKTAFVKNSSLADAPVEHCMVKAFRRMTFPKPDGVVVVTYPFSLQHPEG